MVSSLAELSDMPAGLDLDQPYPQAATGKRGRAGGEKRRKFIARVRKLS